MKAGYKKKKLNIALSIPPIVIPAFMTPIAAEFSEERWLQILSPIVYAFVAVAAALTAFFAYAKKREYLFSQSHPSLVENAIEPWDNSFHAANRYVGGLRLA